MNKRIATVLLVMILALACQAEAALKKVYNEDINPVEQIDQALAQAKSTGKFVICQVGGNWCPWCLRFADFIENDSDISKVVNDNFVYIHVNYNPRQSAGEEKTRQAAEMMKRLGNPARFGFPQCSLSSTRQAKSSTHKIPASWKRTSHTAKRKHSVSSRIGLRQQ